MSPRHEDGRPGEQFGAADETGRVREARRSGPSLPTRRPPRRRWIKTWWEHVEGERRRRALDLRARVDAATTSMKASRPRRYVVDLRNFKDEQ